MENESQSANYADEDAQQKYPDESRDRPLDGSTTGKL